MVLKTIEGMETRPTTDRIKETLFNMLQDDIPGAYFLDLFAGSGQIGIEALSRGAKKAFFVEKNRDCILCIKDNLKKTRLDMDAVVLPVDVISAIGRLQSAKTLGDRVFDLIFMDPPYQLGIERDVLDALSTSDLIDDDTRIIIEADLKTDFSWIEECGFYIEKEKIYKTNKHLFVRRGEE